MVLQAIRYSRGSLSILDQLVLPHRETYFPIADCEEAWNAIHSMSVRGAPAIAIVAALALAVELVQNPPSHASSSAAAEFIHDRLNFLVTSRPTAVNLGDAVEKLSLVVDEAERAESATAETVRQAYITAAEQMLVDDVSDNEAIGKHGAEWILKNAGVPDGGEVSMLTHCNTGYVGCHPH